MTPTPLSNHDAAWFRDAFLYAPIGMALVGLDGRFMLVNPSILAILGYTEEELYALSYEEITYPEDQEQDRAYVQQLLAGELNSFRIEKRYFHKNGALIHCLLTVSLVHDEHGAPLHFIAQLVDITESIQNKEELTALHKRIAETLESISDGFYTVDHDYKFIYANQAAIQFFRKTKDQLIGQNIWEVFPALSESTSMQQLAYACSSKQPVRFEEYIVPYNQWFEAKAYPSEFGLSVHFHNITERKRTADKLLESEQSFRLLAENSSDIISKHAMDGKVTYISPACFPLLGYGSSELIGKTPFDFCHPDDRERLRLTMEANPDKIDAVDSVNYRLRRKDGTYRWFESTGNSVFHEEDRTFTIVAVTRDITPRKEIELKMLEQYQLMHEQTHIDELTRIANRRSFDETWKQEWDDAHNHDMPLTLMLCDIDDFKKYNDHFGHQQGDACLRTVASTLRVALKRKNDFVARYGGEEFAVILPQTDEIRAKSMAKLLLAAILQKRLPHAETSDSEVVTLSIGIATWRPEHKLPQESLFALADKALYKAKREGKNRYSTAEILS